MAYAELALRSRETKSRDYIEKAKTLVKQAYTFTEHAEDKINYAKNLFCLPLFTLPSMAHRMSSATVNEYLGTITRPLDEIISIIEDSMQSSANVSKQFLIGTMTNLVILRSLQRTELTEAGYVALPALPWENRPLTNGAFISAKHDPQYRSPLIPNSSYNIAIVRLDNPTDVTPIRTSVSQPTSLYEDAIIPINGKACAKYLAHKRGEASLEPLGKQINNASKEQVEEYYRHIFEYVTFKIFSDINHPLDVAEAI